jgi:hypothetical protein
MVTISAIVNTSLLSTLASEDRWSRLILRSQRRGDGNPSLSVHSDDFQRGNDPWEVVAHSPVLVMNARSKSQVSARLVGLQSSVYSSASKP